MQDTINIELPLLLPDIDNEEDPCVGRLVERLKVQKGIELAEVRRQDGQAALALKYDKDLLSLAQVQRIASEAGAELGKRYRHETLKITGMDCADCAPTIEHILGRTAGIGQVSVNYAAEKMWVEYDSEVINHK